jgi:AraC-like DNA-binding protein
VKSIGRYVVSGGSGARRLGFDVPTLSVGALSHIPDALRDLGASPAEAFAAAGLDPALFDDPGARISYRTASHLFQVCTDRTGCPHFGLLKGQKSGLDVLGLVGLLVKYAPDVGTALRNLVRFMHLHIRGAVTTLSVEGKLATLAYEIYAPGSEATDQIADASLATMFNIMTELCGPRWMPVEVRFEHRRPSNLAPFHHFFQAPLSFDMQENALVFAASWLSRPLPTANVELKRLLRDKVHELEAQYQDNFPGQVRSILRTALPTGHATAGQVAALLSMHSRTLHRHLAEYGTNFRALVDECRCEIAQQLLKDTDRDVGDIAYLLGYADKSAFARAFRRWSGSSPGNWRTRNQRESKTARVRRRQA